jgi:hypothetical protein
MGNQMTSTAKCNIKNDNVFSRVPDPDPVLLASWIRILPSTSKNNEEKP